jgi:Tfp pilus assembly protein PilN
MFTIDLLKGQGIPARTRPEGIIAMAATAVIPLMTALIMLAVFLSNRIVMNIERREAADYEQKISQLSDAMKTYRSYEQQKSAALKRISEAVEAVDGRQQWSDVLVTVVRNMPDSMVLKRMAVESKAVRVKVNDAKDPEKKVDKMVPAQTLTLTLGAAAGSISDRQVQEFREKLRSSPLLSAKLEDIPVSQKVETVDDREVITYEMKCIFKPQL